MMTWYNISRSPSYLTEGKCSKESTSCLNQNNSKHTLPPAVKMEEVPGTAVHMVPEMMTPRI
jgi:hypothetical protein